MTEKKHTRENKKKIRQLSKMVDYRHSERWFQHIMKAAIVITGFCFLAILSMSAGMLHGKNRNFFLLSVIFLIDFISFEISNPLKSWTRFGVFWIVLLSLFFIVFWDSFFLHYDFPWWLRGLMATE